MTEWVKEDNWGAVKIGQLVRMQHLHDAREGLVLGEDNEPLYLAGRSLRWYRDFGWTLYVPARPEPALPTEPGVYEAAAYPIAEGYAPYILEYGVLRESGTTVTVNATEAAEIGPFTRLEPVPVTAKKVLDRLRQVSIGITGTRDEESRSIFVSSWNSVAAEFGVTTDD